jgi:hypothetical protein
LRLDCNVYKHVYTYIPINTLCKPETDNQNQSQKPGEGGLCATKEGTERYHGIDTEPTGTAHTHKNSQNYPTSRENALGLDGRSHGGRGRRAPVSSLVPDLAFEECDRQRSFHGDLGLFGAVREEECTECLRQPSVV